MCEPKNSIGADCPAFTFAEFGQNRMFLPGFVDINTFYLAGKATYHKNSQKAHTYWKIRSRQIIVSTTRFSNEAKKRKISLSSNCLLTRR